MPDERKGIGRFRSRCGDAIAGAGASGQAGVGEWRVKTWAERVVQACANDARKTPELPSPAGEVVRTSVVRGPSGPVEERTRAVVDAGGSHRRFRLRPPPLIGTVSRWNGMPVAFGQSLVVFPNGHFVAFGVLDPVCGGVTFLSPVARRMVESLEDCSPRCARQQRINSDRSAWSASVPRCSTIM